MYKRISVLPPLAQRVIQDLHSGMDVFDVMWNSLMFDEVGVFSFIVENVSFSSSSEEQIWLFQMYLAVMLHRLQRLHSDMHISDFGTKMLNLRNLLHVNTGFIHDLRVYLSCSYNPFKEESVLLMKDNPYPTPFSRHKLQSFIELCKLKQISLHDMVVCTMYVFDLSFQTTLDLFMTFNIDVVKSMKDGTTNL